MQIVLHYIAKRVIEQRGKAYVKGEAWELNPVTLDTELTLDQYIGIENEHSDWRVDGELSRIATMELLLSRTD